MNEDEIIELSESEIEKIERVENAVATRVQAEAEKERHRKLRVLFQRTAREQLPFVVYVIYMGALSLFSINRLMTIEGQKLLLGIGVFIAALTVPLLVLWMGMRGTNNEQDGMGPVDA